MFTCGEDSHSSVPNLAFGRGLGGTMGVKNLPKQLWDSLYNMQQQARETESQGNSAVRQDTESTRPGPRKGRKPNQDGELYKNVH